MIILGGSYYNGPKSIFTGTAIIKDVNKIVLQNGIYDRLYVSNDISKQEIVDTYTSEAAKSVKIESGINRIETIDVYGKTTQEGTGGASPDNLRNIKNAGVRNKVMTVTGNTEGLFMSTIIANKAVVFVKDAMPTQAPLCDRYRSNNVTATDKTCWIDQNRNFGVTDSRFTSLEEAKRILNEEPVTFAYISTTDTGKFYTGIETTQGDEYRCEIIELQDRLHEGDKVETNVQSEYDAELIVDGAKVVSVSQTSSGNYRINLNVPDDFPVPEALDVPNAKANNLLPTAANTLQSFDVKGVFCAYLSAIYIVLEDQTVTTKEAAQSYFNNNPLRIFYKSASGGTGKNVRRETHNSKTRIITGTENDILFNPKYNSLSIKVDNLAGDKSQEQVPGIVKSSHFKTNATVNGIQAQPKYNQVTILSASVFNSTESAKAYFAQQYAAGTPVTIEYELAQPEVFADELVIVENKAGEYTVSFESTGRVKLKPVINQEGWSDDTIIDAGFNGDLAGGNVDFTAESIDKIRIKRRKKGTANWVDLKDITINVPDDFTFTFYDLFAANAAEYTYAVVPVIGDIEGNLSTVDIQSMFNGFFIADKNTIYGTEYNVNVGAATKNEKSSVVQTLGAKYPFIIDNGYNNYYTVPISLFFYNPNLDWQQNVQYRQTIVEWLHNGTAKIFKSEDGRIWLAKVTTAPVLTPGSNLNITSIDFSITEIGESNSTEDLYNSGLLSLIKES